MAEWCTEDYVITSVVVSKLNEVHDLFSELCRGDITKGGSVRLSDLMGQLGFDGDRGGLTEQSGVVSYGLSPINGYHFVVSDNFSTFNVTRALAKHLKTDFEVDVIYRFSEGPDLEHESDAQHFVAYNPYGLAERLKEAISASVHHFGEDGEEVKFRIFAPLNNMVVDSIGPEGDTIHLVRMEGMESAADRMTVHVDDISDPYILEQVLDFVNDNFTEVVHEMEESQDSSHELLLVPFDIEKERVGILAGLYGSSEAYQNISENMMGFDLEYIPSKVLPLTAVDALEAARNAVLEDGGETDLSGEVQMEMDKGASPEEALREWDIDLPVKQVPERFNVCFDGDVMMSFMPGKKRPEADLWTLAYENQELLSFAYKKSGINVRKELGLGGEGVREISGWKLMDSLEKVLCSSVNLKYVSDARERTIRKIRQKDAYRRFNGALARGESEALYNKNSSGRHV